jgi:hypothetical protein
MPKPNILFIMTDNQGAWTLGCHGNEDIRTPQIDRLAADGVRFTDAYCVNSVCSPSRATYLTGLIPSQHGVHSYLGGEKPDAQMGPQAYNTISEFTTLRAGRSLSTARRETGSIELPSCRLRPSRLWRCTGQRIRHHTCCAPGFRRPSPRKLKARQPMSTERPTAATSTSGSR